MDTIGNEINGTKIENLNKKFKEIREKIINVNSYNDLKELRSSLGPYYSLSIFADMAFSHTWEKLNLSPSDDDLEKRIQVMVAEILHLYPGAVLADLAIKIGSDPYRHCFGIYGGDRKTYQRYLTNYLKTYESGLYAPHLLLLKEKTHGILNYENRDGEETRREEAVSRKDLCKLQISSFQEYENPDNLEEGSKEDSLEFPNFREEVTEPTFGTTGCKNSFKILYFHGGCNTSYSLLNEEGNEEDEDNDKDGAFAQLFLTLKKGEKDKFYFPEDVALAILRSMNRLATVAALQKLQEQQRQLERESQMLKLLMEPLNQITAGLEQTTESAQRLRAVLYDPQQSIFSAASRVWRYFEEGSQVDIAGEQVVVEHNLDKYKEGDGPKRLSLILLAILSEIFGYDPPNITSTTELWAKVYAYIEGGDPAFEDLRNTCKNIIEASPSFQSPVSSSEVFKVLQKQVDGSEEEEKHLEHLGEIWNRFKKLLHEPYKFHPNSFSIMPLVLVVLVQSKSTTVNEKEYTKSITVNEKEYTKLPEFLASEDRESTVFGESDLPFPRPAVLWTLVQHLQQTRPLKSATVEDQKIKLIFTKYVFEQKNQDALAATLKGLIKTKSSTGFLGGDSTSHWFEFACACEGEVTCAIGNNKNGFSICIEKGSTFKFEVLEDTVSFEVMKKETLTSKTTNGDDESNQNTKRSVPSLDSVDEAFSALDSSESQS